METNGYVFGNFLQFFNLIRQGTDNENCRNEVMAKI